MIRGPAVNQFNWLYSNADAPSTTPGTAVTPGTSNAEGSWVQIASAANIANRVYALALNLNAGNSTGVAKNHLLDIGIDQAGGTSYTAVFQNLPIGQSGPFTEGARSFYFPLEIPAGASVAARIQGSDATAGSVRVVAKFYGKPSRPDLLRVGRYTETVGTITNSLGVSVTPGNSGAEGSWVSLGTLAQRCWFYQLGVQCNNGTVTAMVYHFDLAVGDGTNKNIIIPNHCVYVRGTAEAANNFADTLAYRDLPAGAELFLRGSASGTAVSGWNAAVIAVGG